MTVISHPRVRTSCLTIPGSRPRMLAKAADSGARQVILDLEDSVAPADKPSAREAIVQTLNQESWSASTRSVRINGCRTPWALRDVETIVLGAPQGLHSLIVPKVESCEEVHYLDLLLQHLEQEISAVPPRIGIELQIESPRGLIELPQLLKASERIEAVLLGPGDLATALGWPTTTIGGLSPSYPGDNWHWVRTHMVVHAHANGVQAIDGPYARLQDHEGLTETAQLAHALGFDGKWVIHPEQIEPVEDVFKVPLREFERAHDLLAAYEAAIDDGLGSLVFGGEMIDEASRRMAELLVERARASGLAIRPTPEQVPYEDRASWRAENLK